MLYDPKWQAEVKPDPMLLSSLIGWLERQPPDDGYEFWCRMCCLGKYFADAGFDILMIGTGNVTLSSGERFELPKYFNRIAQSRPHTYGAALDRAQRISR
jgi:hypothetical protein